MRVVVLDGPTDEVLLTRYREQGRTEDFDRLVHRYEHELYRYLVRYVGDRSLAEDIFQNTFLQVHLKRDLYEEGRPVRPWLYSIAARKLARLGMEQDRVVLLPAFYRQLGAAYLHAYV